MCKINWKILEPGRHVILMKKLGEVIIWLFLEVDLVI